MQEESIVAFGENPATKTKGEAMNRSIRKVVFVVVFGSFVLNLITARQINSGLKIDIGVTTAQASGTNAAVNDASTSDPPCAVDLRALRR